MIYAPDELNQGGMAYALALNMPLIKFKYSAPDKKKYSAPAPFCVLSPRAEFLRGGGRTFLAAFERNSAPDENISALSKIGICPWWKNLDLPLFSPKLNQVCV